MPDLTTYRGRFAPSPSGPLHAGSLVAALGSYLDAKAHNGRWFVRIEDIDPPRQMDGATDIILHQLEAHGLYWDEHVRYQSNQDALYHETLHILNKAGLIYACHCSRKQIRAKAPYYTGVCRELSLPHSFYALRFRNTEPLLSFSDRFHGQVSPKPLFAAEDFILRRRDKLWAYQLAVVCDDRDQRISHIVRGSDLLQPSIWQLSLWQTLNTLEPKGASLPQLAHLPLVTDEEGRKLSKQNHAPALNNADALHNIRQALTALGLPAPKDASLHELLTKAVDDWRQRYVC